MAGYGRVVIGWRFDDRRRYRPDELGQPPVLAGRCIGCSAPTFLMQSGVRSLRERDAALCCDNCYQSNKHLVKEAL